MQTRSKQTPRKIFAGVLLFLGIGFFMVRADCAKAALADHVVINEVFIDSISGTGGTDDDWVELFNPTSQAVDLSGWSIQKTSASGGTLYNQALSGSVPANGYFLIVRNGSSTAQALKDSADLLASDSFSLANNNSIYLVGNSSSIQNATDTDIIDFVGYGTALNFEGSAAAPAIPETKSISRVPDGEDTNQNSADFAVLSVPTPKNSSGSDNSHNNNGVGGTVSLTITTADVPVSNPGAVSADISFQVNSPGRSFVNYGLGNLYGSSTAPLAVLANATATVTLAGLKCDTTYHYSVYAENAGATENDKTADATFKTLPCGLAVNVLNMTRTKAKADDNFLDGWEWEFNITVWDMNEKNLKMKFDRWGGAGVLDAAANMRFSADNGSTWIDIAGNNEYPAAGADISNIDASADAGRQVKIIVRMKVPQGTKAGYYNSNYGILTQ